MDILKANNLHITLFLTGKWIEPNPDLVKRMIDGGRSLGNHTYDHKGLLTLTDAQIADEFTKTEGRSRKLMAAPH